MTTTEQRPADAAVSGTGVAQRLEERPAPLRRR